MAVPRTQRLDPNPKPGEMVMAGFFIRGARGDCYCNVYGDDTGDPENPPKTGTRIEACDETGYQHELALADDVRGVYYTRVLPSTPIDEPVTPTRSLSSVPTQSRGAIVADSKGISSRSRR